MSQSTEPVATDREPCRECGGSMDGEHHNAKTCTPCRSVDDPQPVPKKARVPKGTIKVEIDEFPVEDDEGEIHEYWIGTLEECPFQNVTTGGLCFPLFSGRATFNDKAVVEDGHVARGALVHLTEKQVDQVCESVKRRVIRFVGQERDYYVPQLGSQGRDKPIKLRRKRGSIVSIDTGNYRPQPGDEPLAKYIYMVRTDAMDFHGRDRKPEPMLQE